MIFRQFCTSDDEISYLLADPVTRYAALLDPNLLAEPDYIEVMNRLDLRLVYVIETHAHESHLSAASVLRTDTGARLVTHSEADISCVDMHVDAGDSIFVGEECISVLATPGHSMCSLSIRWRDRVFTGHTLLAGATGPCLRDDANAGQLFDSVEQRLFALPDETLVYPGRIRNGWRISSIGQERAMNADLQPGTTRGQFIERKQLEAMYGRTWKNDSLAANRHCGI
ncbi:MAG TPA: MBL fold metallo-hydrolase [Gammaproteobacteria bacterium]|nr:MBL fold metallo-hydrolase [Gammaproteobacteria bacterium]